MRRVPLSRRVPLRFRSSKRAAVMPARRALVATLLAERPWCQRCGVERSTDVHEPLTRAQGGNILDPENTRAICRRCHDHVHTHPAQSYAEGWLIRRSAA